MLISCGFVTMWLAFNCWAIVNIKIINLWIFFGTELWQNGHSVRFLAYSIMASSDESRTCRPYSHRLNLLLIKDITALWLIEQCVTLCLIKGKQLLSWPTSASLLIPAVSLWPRRVVLQGKYRESTESAFCKLHLFKNAWIMIIKAG